MINSIIKACLPWVVVDDTHELSYTYTWVAVHIRMSCLWMRHVSCLWMRHVITHVMSMNETRDLFWMSRLTHFDWVAWLIHRKELWYLAFSRSSSSTWKASDSTYRTEVISMNASRRKRCGTWLGLGFSSRISASAQHERRPRPTNPRTQPPSH